MSGLKGNHSVLVGTPGSPDMAKLQGFLTHSGCPNLVLDAAVDGEGHDLVERLGVLPDELPLMVCPNGTVLRNPATVEVAACLGMVADIDPATVYDVAIVGAGPAGLAAAVYAASEGLSVIVLDGGAMGGQAGRSSRIENYLGFPTGIPGQALAGRAFNQALKFGAEIAIPRGVEAPDCREAQPGEPLALVLPESRRLNAHTVVVASGARYRRPNVPDLATFEGAGISYWASPIEAKLRAGEEVALVERLHLVVRRPIEETTSRYLVDRIAALEGNRTRGQSGAVFRNRGDGAEKRCAMRHLFLFIGADPNAAWLDGCVATDAKGFIRTGEDFTSDAVARGRTALPARPCSRSATCAPARPSASPPPSARGRPWWRRSIRRSRTAASHWGQDDLLP